MDSSLLPLTGAVGALTLGLTSSGHCALMCGPLACGTVTLQSRQQKRRAQTSYQTARLGAYATVGGLAATAGSQVAAQLQTIVPILPWVMAGALILSAFEVGKRMPALPGARVLTRAIIGFGARLSPTSRAAAIGAVTPLLPCGLLYGVVLTAAATGTALGGAVTMALFGLATAPALVLATVPARLLGRRPALLRMLRVGLPLLAASALIWRALHTEADGQMNCHEVSAVLSDGKH